MTKTTFSERLVEARAKARLTQKQLADHAGISQRQVARYEGGEQEPRPTTIHRLAEALGVSPRWLATGAEPEQEAAGKLPLPEIIETSFEEEPGRGGSFTLRLRLPVQAGESETEYLAKLAKDQSAPAFFRQFASLRLAGDEVGVSNLLLGVLMQSLESDAAKLGLRPSWAAGKPKKDGP